MIFAMSLDINSFIYNFSSGGGGGEGEGIRGGISAPAGTREYKQSDRGR